MTSCGTVHQVLATLGYGDAIGHEVLGIQRVLRRAGYVSDIFVETADPRLEALTRGYEELPEAVADEDVLIHHFSIGSKASRVAYALPARMILVYHNITPPHYFLEIHNVLVGQCYAGRRELTAYVDRCELALGDSEFNRQELEAVGFSATAVLPVVPGFAHLDVAPNRLLAADFDDEWTNVMFVGRVIPNKRIDDVIRVFQRYKRDHNPRSRLLIVGSYAGFAAYLAMLQQLIVSLDLSDVHFLGHVSNEELTALYDVADLFLSASEHEGFCVPLIEAFYKRVPVVAYAAAAVPATMDGGGVTYDRKDAEHVAAIVDAVLSDPELEEQILTAQDAALARLLGRDFGGLLLQFVETARRSPRKPPHRVTADFWQQLRQSEELEELRCYRPAVYHALPIPRDRRQEAQRSAETKSAEVETKPRPPATDGGTAGLEKSAARCADKRTPDARTTGGR